MGGEKEDDAASLYVTCDTSDREKNEQVAVTSETGTMSSNAREAHVPHRDSDGESETSHNDADDQADRTLITTSQSQQLFGDSFSYSYKHGAV